VGIYDGLGAGVRLGTRAAGVHVLAGWLPLFVAIKEDPPGNQWDFHSTFQGNVDGYLLVYRASQRGELGLTTGYKYSTHLGHGASLGAYIEIDGHTQRPIFILAGVSWFPKGEDRLRDKADYASDIEFRFPGPSLTYAVNIGISLFPGSSC